MTRQGAAADCQLAIGDLLQTDILDGGLFLMQPSGREYRGRHGFWPHAHIHFELLLDHPVTQPVS